MRLICPNCGAQYEVPDEVIPQDGRDVQCSNCGDTWFQSHSDNSDEKDTLAEELEAAEPVTSADENNSLEEQEETEETPDQELTEEPAEEAERPEPASRGLDPAVAGILQQEAEHEAQIRSDEASSGIEIQPDLGLQDAEDDASRRAREAREHMAKMRGEETGDAAEAAAAAALGSRRDLLPDIEEINSTLRSASDRQAESDDSDAYSEPSVARQTSRFRRGFMLTLTLAAIMWLVYAFAPRIAQSVPQAAPALSGYVIAVDKGRMALDVRVKSVLTWLDTKASGATE